MKGTKNMKIYNMQGSCGWCQSCFIWSYQQINNREVYTTKHVVLPPELIPTLCSTLLCGLVLAVRLKQHRLTWEKSFLFIFKWTRILLSHNTCLPQFSLPPHLLDPSSHSCSFSNELLLRIPVRKKQAFNRHQQTWQNTIQ